MKRGKFVIGGAVVVAVSVFIFGRFSGSRTPADGTAELHRSIVSGAGSSRNRAPDFTLERLGGGTITLAEFRGRKSVVLDFWASWCPNCRRDMPNLNRFYEKYKDKVEVIGVNLQESESTIGKFITSNGIAFPIALDPRGEASRAFGIQYTNTHFLIDQAGNLVRAIPGDIRESDIAVLIEGNS